MILLRHLLGDALRRMRLRQGRTLREVSAAARVSLGYLSEVERGQKEASSELLASICSALGAPLSQVMREVSDNFALAELQSEPVLTGVREPSLDGQAGSGPGRAVGKPAVSPSAGPRLSAPASSGLAGPAAAGHLAVQAGQRLVSAQAPVLDSAVLRASQPVVEQVTCGVREITDMVPV